MDSREIGALVDNLSNLQYDVAADYVKTLADIIQREAATLSRQKGNYTSAAMHLRMAEKELREAWRHCRKYINENSPYKRELPGLTPAEMTDKFYDVNSVQLLVTLYGQKLWVQGYHHEKQGRHKVTERINNASMHILGASKQICMD